MGIKTLMVCFLAFLTIKTASTSEYIESNDILTSGPVPIVLWHGMGDSCCNPMSMGSVSKFLQQSITGVYVKSLEIGHNQLDDAENSFLMSVNDQVAMACQLIANDSSLAGGYNAVGFSQGGQFLRAVAQRCPNPPMRNLVSFGGQHQGVYGFPRCPSESWKICDYVRRILNEGAYVDWIQRHLAQAQYWHDPLQEEEYKAKSLFLADINNENTKNETYITNLQKLDNIIFVMFSEDKMVDPKETEWFGFYKPGQSQKIVKLQDSPLYADDRLGLKAMDVKGQLHFLTTVGDHLQIDLTWFKENIIDKYLK